MAPSSDLGRIYDEHAQALFSFLLEFTGSEADTRDLLQEVFVRLARRERLLEDVQSERAFLIRLAHNLAVDWIRRGSTRQRNYEQFGMEWAASSGVTVNPDEATFQAALEQALQTLPAEQRTVVHLKVWGGMTFEEIASALDISPNTAASRYRYGIDKLRERLRPLYDEIQ